MKALTICQPYASLIINPPHLKRIENRTWPTTYRGQIAIHAGKSKKYLGTWDTDRMPDPMPYGVIVGTARLVDCLNLQSWIEDPRPLPGLSGETMTNLMLGEFAEGPWCWVLDGFQRFDQPIPCMGLMGLWNVPGDVLDHVLDAMKGPK